MLESAERWSAELDGVSPFGSGEFKAIRALQALGLVEFIGCGSSDRHRDDDEHPIFAITDAGRVELTVPPIPEGK